MGKISTGLIWTCGRLRGKTSLSVGVGSSCATCGVME